MRRAGSIFIALAALSLNAPAGAQSSPVNLVWDAPPGCPSRDEVLQRVTELRASSAPAAILDARAQVTRGGRRWRVRIETRDGARTLAAQRCTSLAEATAVVLALALDDAAPSPNAPRPALPPEVEQVDDSERPPVLRPAPAPPPQPRFPGVELGARALIDVNGLPGVGGGVALALALQWRVLRVEIAPTLVYGARGEVAPQGAALAAVRATLATRLCALSSGRERVGLCALAELGWLHGRAEGFSVSSAGDAPWVAAGLSLLARVGGGRTGGVIALDAALPIARPRFVVEGSASAYEVPALVLSLSAGVSFGL